MSRPACTSTTEAIPPLRMAENTRTIRLIGPSRCEHKRALMLPLIIVKTDPHKKPLGASSRYHSLAHTARGLSIPDLQFCLIFFNCAPRMASTVINWIAFHDINNMRSICKYCCKIASFPLAETIHGVSNITRVSAWRCLRCKLLPTLTAIFILKN